MNVKNRSNLLTILLVVIGILSAGMIVGTIILLNRRIGGTAADSGRAVARKLVAVGEANFPPFIFRGADGEARGFDIDLLLELAALKNLDLEIRLTDWTSANRMIQGGEADILIGVSALEARRAVLSFSERMLSMKSSIFVGRDTYAYTGITDVPHSTPVAVQEGDIAAQYLRTRYPEIDLVEFPDQDSAFRALASGRFEIAVLDYYTGLLLLQRMKLRSEIKIIGDPLIEAAYCFGVRKGNEELLIPINEGLETLKTDGTIGRLQDRWLGSVDMVGRNWRIVMYGLLGFFTIAVVLFAWIVSLRNAVRQRTGQLALSDELFRLYMEYSPVYMFFKDEHLRSLKLSRNYEKMLGRPLGELLNRTTRELFPPEIARSIEEADFAILREGKPVTVEEELNGRIYTTIKFPIERKGKPPYLAGFTIDITENKLAERKIAQSLEEKETLLRELYHRTKNTLQVVGSMLMLQAAEHRDNDELQKLVRNTEDRIQAIALVHQMLYRSRDLSRISIRDYISELCSLIFRVYGASPDLITLDLRIADGTFSLDTAIPVGLILNELLTNSVKHAFPGGRKGKITVIMEIDGENVTLRYSDDGVGVDGGFDFRTRNSLGLSLIYNLGELQLQGTVEMKGDNGVSCRIVFRNDLHAVRV